ncbi:MAG: hypothetical protein J5I98_02775, partial [Phaeodactylibacter sp.]|nr:hypothetical protein [Phaeodactylibacter sp.]
MPGRAGRLPAIPGIFSRPISDPVRRKPSRTQRLAPCCRGAAPDFAGMALFLQHPEKAEFPVPGKRAPFLDKHRAFVLFLFEFFYLHFEQLRFRVCLEVVLWKRKCQIWGSHKVHFLVHSLATDQKITAVRFQNLAF